MARHFHGRFLMTTKRVKTEQPLHERYDRSHPLLRELVRLHVDADDGTSFSTLLPRVPGIGEEIFEEDRCYKVLRVQHSKVDDDGRAIAGNHAYVEAAHQPPDELIPRKRKRSPRWVSGGLRDRYFFRSTFTLRTCLWQSRQDLTAPIHSKAAASKFSFSAAALSRRIELRKSRVKSR